MKAGNVVTVYLDPYTRQNPEGRARLIRRLSEDRWDVRFLGPEEPVVQRTIPLEEGTQ